MADNELPAPKRTDDFEARYANNVRLESSFWDLKLIFGVLDGQVPNGPRVDVHTAINIPWPQVKLLIYYAFVNVMIHEHFEGTTIHVSDGLVPTPLDDYLPDVAKTPKGKQLVEELDQLRSVLFGTSVEQ